MKNLNTSNNILKQMRSFMGNQCSSRNRGETDSNFFLQISIEHKHFAVTAILKSHILTLHITMNYMNQVLKQLVTVQLSLDYQLS